MKRKKYKAKNRFLQNLSTDSKGTTFVILKNHASTPVKTERLRPTSKERRKASRNEFEEKGWMPDRVQSFREVDCSENRPRAQFGFVKRIRS